ncbi:STAS domain-containing protein [Anaeromyxobacter sp. Fw109-5]|uniref:STAS domain-containing protein n=1 Tax=Anaeromyxobacter sp. (strain Fw109-5) TaxID=404589 RepID=UPI0000ED80E8|nr:STAS domain-containing protein [Anaeromyxobacter sp. Fw109-5]ABS25010.1 anti-sigma-factor antagonist [Anaeromyxobacter sp. Fw109-5]
MATQTSHLPRILDRHADGLLADWIREQRQVSSRTGAIKEAELREECGEFLRLLRQAVGDGSAVDVNGPEFDPLRELLANVSRTRGTQGFSPTETATFVFSFKRPLFQRLREELGRDTAAFADETWATTELLDRLGLFTTEVYQKTREQVIARQQEEMLELSTPVVKLWDGILALPMIGTLDSNRTQVVMETLLEKIVETGSQVAIIDITGVPTVDTLVAQHLMKTVAAARLMGADCIISGIRPAIAQTIVHLAIDLGNVITKANLADAFKTALERLGTESTALARR